MSDYEDDFEDSETNSSSPSVKKPVVPVVTAAPLPVPAAPYVAPSGVPQATTTAPQVAPVQAVVHQPVSTSASVAYAPPISSTIVSAPQVVSTQAPVVQSATNPMSAADIIAAASAAPLPVRPVVSKPPPTAVSNNSSLSSLSSSDVSSISTLGATAVRPTPVSAAVHQSPIPVAAAPTPSPSPVVQTTAPPSPALGVTPTNTGAQLNNPYSAQPGAYQPPPTPTPTPTPATGAVGTQPSATTSSASVIASSVILPHGLPPQLPQPHSTTFILSSPGMPAAATTLPSTATTTTTTTTAMPGVDCAIFSGPAGVGKGTIIDMLQKDDPNRYAFSVSHATRAPREGEVDGVHYHFTTVEKFEAMIAADEFVEYANVHTNYYGTSKAALAKVSSVGKIAIVEIDVKGAKIFKERMRHTNEPTTTTTTLTHAPPPTIRSLQCRYFFIKAPTIQDLQMRMRARGKDTEESIARRLETATEELALIGLNPQLYDHVLTNANLQATFAEVKQLLLSAAPSPSSNAIPGPAVPVAVAASPPAVVDVPGNIFMPKKKPCHFAGTSVTVPVKRIHVDPSSQRTADLKQKMKDKQKALVEHAKEQLLRRELYVKKVTDERKAEDIKRRQLAGTSITSATDGALVTMPKAGPVVVPSLPEAELFAAMDQTNPQELPSNLCGVVYYNDHEKVKDVIDNLNKQAKGGATKLLDQWGYVPYRSRYYGIKKQTDLATKTQNYCLGLGCKGTPLHFAVLAGRLDVVVTLLQNGAKWKHPKEMSAGTPSARELAKANNFQGAVDFIDAFQKEVEEKAQQVKDLVLGGQLRYEKDLRRKAKARRAAEKLGEEDALTMMANPRLDP